ncbi:anti-sigma factor [Alsobacter metallidurans]|nr:anti-sigma factor [Alsobacter metallidurans]
MPMTPEDADALAGEYVLGTLGADERAAFGRALERDPALRALVADWERRLSPLAQGVEPVSPTADVWRAIAQAIGPDPVVQLRRQVLRWRVATGVAAALAASLAIAPWLRPAAPPAAGRYVAVVNRSGDLPALIVRVDVATGAVTLRPVAMEPPAGRSLELWYIRDGAAPRSLGVVHDGAQQVAAPAELRNDARTSITFAVSVEPSGGSPTGGPTGPVIYSGKLIPE